MLLTEHPVNLISVPVSLLNLHAVVTSPCTLYMKWYLTSGSHALHTCTTILLQTDDTLQRESFIFKSVQSNWCLGSHNWTWYPSWATYVNPLIESFCLGYIWWLKSGLVSLQEEVVVFWELLIFFVLLKEQFQFLHWIVIFIIQLYIIWYEYIFTCNFILEINFFFEYNSQTETSIFS
jgi:hypothetical protein